MGNSPFISFVIHSKKDSGGAAAAGHSLGGGVVQLLQHGAVQLIGVNADGPQDAQAHIAALPEQPHQQVLRADVAAAHAGGLGHGQLHHALGPGRQALTGGSAGDAVAHAALQHGAHHLVGDAELGQHPVGDALLLADQAQQQVLRTHVAVAQLLCGLLTQTQSFLCAGGEFILRHKKHFLSMCEWGSSALRR